MPAKTKGIAMCRVCKDRPVRQGGGYRCEECKSSNGDGCQRLYWKRVAQGLCSRCGEGPPRPGKRSCQGCTDAQIARLAVRYVRLKAAGRCVACNRHAVWRGLVLCLRCYRKSRKRVNSEATG